MMILGQYFSRYDLGCLALVLIIGAFTMMGIAFVMILLLGGS